MLACFVFVFGFSVIKAHAKEPLKISDYTDEVSYIQLPFFDQVTTLFYVIDRHFDQCFFVITGQNTINTIKISCENFKKN